MSLSHLIRHIYNNASEEVIKRGKKIHSFSNIDIIDHNMLVNNIVFRIKDDIYNTWYKVKIDNYIDSRAMTLRCTCPYNLSEVCRHKAAALLYLQDMSDRGMLEGKQIEYDQRHTQAKIRLIAIKDIKTLTGNENFEEAVELLRTHSINIISAAKEIVNAEWPLNGTIYTIRIGKNEERFFDTSCTCVDTAHTLCKHKTALFLQLLNAHGASYFDSIRNVDRDKSKLLAAYGYSLDDNLKGKFEFGMREGRPFLRVLDPSIKRVNMPHQVTPPAATSVAEQTKVIQKIAAPAKALGIVFKNKKSGYPWLETLAISGEAAEQKGIVGKIENIDLSKYVPTEDFSDEDKVLLQQMRKLGDADMNKFLNRNSPYSGIWDNIVIANGSDLPEETRILINEYLQPKIERLFVEYHEKNQAYYLPLGKKFITANLIPIELDPHTLTPVIKIQAEKDGVTIFALGKNEDRSILLSDNEWDSDLAIKLADKLYTWTKPEDVEIARTYKKAVSMNYEKWSEYAEKHIVPIQKDYDIQFDKKLIIETEIADPLIEVELQEKGEFLIITPLYTYGSTLAPAVDTESIQEIKDGKVQIIYRNLVKERAFFQKLNALHTNFILPEGRRQLVLKGTDVLKGNWFFLFMDTMREMEVAVNGFEALRNFKFNNAKPSTKVRISSGLDWFDAQVQITFGDQHVRVSDVKKALAEKKTVVSLSDGTLGILPEDWVKKYGLLLKVGEGSGGQLRLSRYQFGVIDELYDQRDDDELQVELEEKFERLRDFKHIKKLDPPEHLNNTLRPYQVTGFHWLNFLQETGCGGILADDMGLGKTLQALTMLEHYEHSKGSLRALVVCPTSLLYNWENEIKKFTPNLEYFIHHGAGRGRNSKELGTHHIVITTFGTLRSDILMFQELEYDYVVLDESQAIKNPNSKVAKAACLLRSKHRVCMSGTPLQNNTFDIYAQMNFLNPGLLGSVEFFKNEFATPIDKFGEQEHKEHLRKLLYPFILRRTKEQVAKDLPEKTETILYCEMENEQRRVYDAYRNEYRDKVLGVIDSDGMGRSQLTILQGLMKLRQICDSPAILNEEVKLPNNSIKLDELYREIDENIGEHKALIFSQFLGMLDLIRKKFDKNNIKYEYFDGSTPIHERQRAIDNFQNNSECRVFLISLKAGGVGLNLTAADYVYIVDPWWNPAVEQQAIDRTHRIGQTRNIFAYRMICKDTVEDKIIKLQEKKRQLARELISDDTGFVKNLSRSDIEYLFS